MIATLCSPGKPSESPHHPDYVPTLFAHKKDKKNLVAARLRRAASRSLASEVHRFSEAEPMDSCELFTGLYFLTLNVFFNYWLLEL